MKAKLTVSAIAALCFWSAAGSVALAQSQPGALLGVNLSGAEGATNAMPGKLGTNYVYPTAQEVDFAYDHGVRMFRLPLREDRIQDGIGGPLRPEVKQYIYPLIDHIRSKPGTIVVIDWHSFGKRQGTTIGTGAWDAAAVVDLNAKFIAPYKGASNVWLGLQNEPKAAGDSWWSTAQQVVLALRQRGIENTISVAGEGYSAAKSWKTHNGPQARRFKAPLNNVVFETHTYFDKTGAGVSGDCVAGAAKRLDPAIEDAEANGYRLFIGEAAVGNGKNCAAVLSAVIQKIKASKNVVGITWWTMGKFYPYPKYVYGLTEKDGSASPIFDTILADWRSTD